MRCLSMNPLLDIKRPVNRETGKPRGFAFDVSHQGSMREGHRSS